ncbi:MAG: nucleotidyl transferase AbiEii/AbiGii toxin family protein [Propionibacteriaceae bacterium]|jgi:hypothetical protein|nr:nucleotidyl transferase AbiEii/AbiGii toxin family protein [Propionibacteriaceae bacterium]
MLTPFQQEVAAILGEVTQDDDFAVGGGAALQLHGVVDRVSKDIDAYTTSYDPAVYERVEKNMVTALTSRGYNVTVTKRLDWFRAMTITEPHTGEQVGIDLGVMSRAAPAENMPPIGRVLALTDVREGKLDALLNRAAARDFTDIDALIQNGRWALDGIATSIQTRHPETSIEEVAQAFESVSQVDTWEFSDLNMTDTDVKELAQRFHDYAQQLTQLAASQGTIS